MPMCKCVSPTGQQRDSVTLTEQVVCGFFIKMLIKLSVHKTTSQLQEQSSVIQNALGKEL